uniref:Integrator complex subunit 4 n=1 Tax=Ursus maritimus TaxID=29073 RepID=A0A452U465_URSMA
MAAHLKKRVYEEFTKVVQQQQEEIATKKLRLTKPSKSAALHIDLCKATSPADALQYLLQFARKPVEAESVEGVVRILLEHYYKENDPSVRLKIASLLGLLSKTAGFSPDCIMDDAINILQNENSGKKIKCITWMAQSVQRLPSAQVMISGSWNQVLHQALCSAGSLLSLPLPPVHALFLLLSLINK